MNKSRLDLVFSALSDPTRRSMLAQLAEGERNITALAERYDVSQPAISKHLGVLEKAGLIHRTKSGREFLIRVDPRPIDEARNWIAHYERFWKDQFDAVGAYLDARKNQSRH